MMNKITLTGADNNTNIRDMVEISKEYPEVEWGILVSRSQVGSPRFPDFKWQYALREVASQNEMNISCHICGAWVRDLLIGGDMFFEELPPIVETAKRIQINTHAERHSIYEDGFITNLRMLDNREIIIQYDNVNNHLLNWAIDGGVNAVPLFDLSHGAGVLPSNWPKPVGDYCGYAGGLSPDNVAKQLIDIKAAAGNNDFWIDAETHLRTNEIFDLMKCIRFIEEAKT